MSGTNRRNSLVSVDGAASSRIEPGARDEIETAGLLRGAYRRLKRSPHVGPLVRRMDESMRDWSIRVNPYRRTRLEQEWRSCTSEISMLDFASKHFKPSQKPDEILKFATFARATNPEVFCEIGTLHGGTHFFLTHVLSSVTVAIAIDLLVENKAKLRLFEKPGQRSFFVNAASALPATVDRVERFLSGRSIDLLFIDGDHSYEGVRADFIAYRRFVRDGGLIAFHDICEDHRTRFGRSTTNYAGGVPLLWKALRASYEHREFVNSPDQDAFGIGVIVHSAAAALPNL
jgi:cephalosporin hydroxylase